MNIKGHQELELWPSAIDDGTVCKSGETSKGSSACRDQVQLTDARSQLHEERPHTEGANCSRPPSAFAEFLLRFGVVWVFSKQINLSDKVSDEASQEGLWLVGSHIQLSHFAVAGRERGLPCLNLKTGLNFFSPIFWEVHALHGESE